MQNNDSNRSMTRAEIAAAYDKALDAFLAASLDARGEEQSMGPLSADRYAELGALEAEANQLAAQLRDIDTRAALAIPAAPAPEPEDDDEEEEDIDPGDVPEEPGFNTPAIYIDGTALGYDALPMPEELERVQLAFPDAENGYQTDADRSAPLGWCNSAAIQLDREDDSVTLSISVGDPRGAFTFTIRRATDGSLQMFYPTPAESLLHMPLRRVRDGLYRIGK